MATTLRTSGITMGDSTMDMIGSAPSGPARMWVNFFGQAPVSIRASLNVSSVVRNGAGQYTINMSTALPSTNSAKFGGSENTGFIRLGEDFPLSTSSLGLTRFDGTFQDSSNMFAAAML